MKSTGGVVVPRIRIIPNELRRGDVSPAEYKVFNTFKHSRTGLADGWIVLHSLLLPDERRDGDGWRRRKPEFDFVILIPQYGIVCLEVKGGTRRKVDGKDYDWEALDVPRDRTPFKQASANLSILIDKLDKTFKHDVYDPNKLPLFEAVLLADIEAKTTRPPPCPLYDRRHLEDHGSSLIEAIKKEFTERWFHNDVNREAPNSEEIEEIARRLLPAWTQQFPLRTVTRELDELTVRQYAKLEHTVAANLEDRWVFVGKAGTGKTKIALECARLVKTHHPDWRVGLLCRSRGTESYLRHKIESDSRDIEIMCDDSDGSPFQDHHIDYLIVDDAQDLCSIPHLAQMDRALNGGLSAGRWAMFGDGNLTDTILMHTSDGSQIDLYQTLHDYLGPNVPHISRAPLKIHCRHTSQIALSSLDCLPEDLAMAQSGEVWDLVNGREPRYEYWRDDDELCSLLDEAVNSLRSSITDLRHTDVVVLSTRQLSDTGLASRTAYGGWPLIAGSDGFRRAEVQGEQLYSHTIGSYTGTKSNAVILILDYLDTDSDWWQAYLGMSRARVDLIVLAHERLRDELEPPETDFDC